MKKYNIKKRFNYWLDKEMAKGTISIIKLLSFSVISVVVFVSVLIVLFKLKDTFFSAFWDSFATIINAWMPSSEDGEVGYIILNTLTAIIGLLFTSILIGVISSGIEERIDALRKGNSYVLEEGHTVILGYNQGEHGLLKQLIMASGKRKRCIVIFTDIEKPSMEEDISNNVEVPDNVTVLCRNGDITNVNDLRCCSIETASLVIVNSMNDNRRVKAILAVMILLKDYPDCKVRMVACVSNERYLLPRKKILDKNITMLKTDEIMAKVIAHTATEPGLSIAFKELMNFEENEFYFEKDPRFVGISVLVAAKMIDKAVLVGLVRNGKTILNPDRDIVIEKEDELILFEQEKGSYELHMFEQKDVEDRLPPKKVEDSKGKVAVFGINVLLDTILKELPEDVEEIHIYSDQPEAIEMAEEYKERKIRVIKRYKEGRLEKIVEEYSHIIILADRNSEREDADMNSILLLLKLLDIKERKDYDYNLVVELNMENAYNISPKNQSVDYIVNSNISSLILAQISENPGLEQVFDELLTNKGNELYSRPIKNFNLHDGHDYSFVGLKEIALSYGYTLLGVMHQNQLQMNPGLDERILFDREDRLMLQRRNKGIFPGNNFRKT